MYAAVKSKPEKGIEVQEVEEKMLNEDEVRVKMHFCGICGSDLATYQWRQHKQHLIRYLPRIIGHEGVGTIIEVGSDIRHLKVGQRIATEPIIHCGYCRYCQAGLTNICPNSRLLGSHYDGCMSEYANLPENVCYPISENLPDKQVPFLEVVGVAVHALERVGSVMGKSCAIVGPGAIGLSTLLVLKAVGASEIAVFGTTRNEKRLQKAKELGATETFIIDQEVPQHLKGQFDFVFEAAGKPMALVHSAQLVALGGKICMIGAYDEPVPLAFNTMVRSKEVDMLSSRARTPQSWMRTIALVDQGRIDLSVFNTEVVPLKEAAEGFQRAVSGDSFKVLLNCQDIR